ncbi:MAG: C25 family cysteine peptidase, partial [Bacteroidales bacterium]|nr:C25 family cysteine peptidase [Bacteroidales bacterium]
MCFARMSAENATQMNVLVSKVLEYEYDAPCMDPDYYQNPITALGWQTQRWFQICSEVVGGYLSTHGKTPVRINAIYEGTPGSVWSTAQNTASVVDYFGPNGVGYLPATPSSLGGWSGGTAQHIINAVNNGAFILQHRDHGYEPGWGEPDFTIPNVSSFTNIGKLTYVFSINCLTGKFNHTTPVFAEVLHRYTYNGQNAGAVGVLCPTETSYSFVNDVFVWGVYDLFQPDFMPDYGPYAENSGNWMPGFGNVAGKYFLEQSSWPYNVDVKEITYQMFTQHSDPFLRLYTEVPQTLTVSHAPTIFAGSSSFTVSCEEGAMIALTVNNEIIAVAEATGSSQIMTIPPQVPPTEILVTCTKQNYLRHESTVSVVPAEGPYVIGFEWNVVDENGNQIVEYAENGVIDMTAKNVGIETADNVTMTLSTEDPYVTINKASENFGTIAPESTVLKNNAFSFSVAQDAPNNHSVSLKMESTDGTDVWDSYMSFKIFAPVAEFVGSSVSGEIVPGSTLDVIASFKNNGGAPIYNAIGSLSSTNEHITINNATFNYGNIDASGIVQGIFNVTISDDAPAIEAYDFHVVMMSDYGIAADGDFVIQNVCNVVFDLHDSYGDGWNGAKLRVTFDDGTPQVEYTITGNNNSASFTKEINVGTNVTLTWFSGSYDSECSFTVSYEDGDEIYNRSNPSAGVLHTFECNCNGGSNGCNPINELTATVEETTVDLTWEAVADATSYLIKRNGVEIGTETNTTFTDSDVLPGSYNYCVSAIYENGCVALPTCTEIIISLCASLENVTATVIDSLNIELTWEAVEGSEGYNIYYEGSLVGTSTTTNYMIENLDWETEYCYGVTSLCESGESGKTYACATTPYEPCYIPVEVNASVEDEMTITLTWNATTSAHSYDIYRDGELLGNVIRPLYIDNNLEIGTYCYTVRAKCKVDESELSVESCGNVVGINEFEQNYQVYPNPANTNLTIEGENIENIVVYNTLGQVVFSQKVSGEKSFNLSTENWVDGLYILRLVSREGQTAVERISIVH